MEDKRPWSRKQILLLDLQKTLVKEVTRKIEAQLEHEVSTWLYRGFYARRLQVTRRRQASCQKCGSQKACQFMRNGYRERQLVTQFGMYRQRGLELFIHDGGKGLHAAHDYLYPHIPHQRCAFHKLQNLWHTIQTPDGLTLNERIELKLHILQPLEAIFYAQDERKRSCCAMPFHGHGNLPNRH